MPIPHIFANASSPIPLSQLDDNFSAAGVYDPAGTGAVATTIQNKLRESASVKDFGAIGDGVTDDTAAIQAAINYGSLHSKNIFIPSGVYLCSDSLYLYYDPVLNPGGCINETNAGSFSIKGEGRFAHLQFVTGVSSWIGSVLHFTHATKDGFVHSKLTAGAASVPPSCKGIEDLSIVCNTTGWGMSLAWFSRAVISNVGVFNANAAGNGVKLVDCWEYSLKDCMIAASALSSGIGVQITNVNSLGGSVEEIRGCTILYYAKGIAIGQSSLGKAIISTMVDYNLIYGCVTGIECDAGAWKTVISRNYFEGSKGTDISILAALSTDILNNAHSATDGLAAYIRIDLSQNSRGTRVFQNFITLLPNEVGVKTSGVIETNTIIEANHFVPIGVGVGRIGIYAVGNAHQQSAAIGNTFEGIDTAYSGSVPYFGRVEKASCRFVCTPLQSDYVMDSRVVGDSFQRFNINAAGGMSWGSGGGATDTTLGRIGAGVLRNQAGGKFISQGGFGFGNSLAATTPGAVVKKIEVFDNVGASLGFVPVYSSIA